MKIPQYKIVASERIAARERPQITNSRDAHQVLMPFFEEHMDIREVSYAIILNRTSRVLGVYMVSMGSTSSTIMCPKSIAHACILANGTSIIVSHNHPSGDLRPSQQDTTHTKRLKDALKLLDITLLDHVILTYDGYYSFADEGML